MQDSQVRQMSSIQFEVTTAQASTNARVGIYTSKQGEPRNLIEQSGNISLSSTGIKTYSLSTTTQAQQASVSLTTCLRFRSSETRRRRFHLKTSFLSFGRLHLDSRRLRQSPGLLRLTHRLYE